MRIPRGRTSSRVSGADPAELGRARVFYNVKDESAPAWEISEDGAGYSTVIIDPEAVGSFDDVEVTHVIVHELLHAVGFVSHTDPERYASTLSSVGFYPGTQRRVPIHPIDREGLLAAYSRFSPGASPDAITVETLGPWSEISYHLRGDIDFEPGEMSFGVAFRNGLPQPWVFGPKPPTALRDNQALTENVTWRGALVGATATGDGVIGDSVLTLEMSDFTGELDFTGIRFESGATWGDGDLRYRIRVDGSDNTFGRADAEFRKVGPGYEWTGADLGTITGVFFGPLHEGMGGVLERHDLSAAFGGKR